MQSVMRNQTVQTGGAEENRPHNVGVLSCPHENENPTSRGAVSITTTSAASLHRKPEHHCVQGQCRDEGPGAEAAKRTGRCFLDA